MPTLENLSDPNKHGLGAGLQAGGQGLMQVAALMQRGSEQRAQEERWDARVRREMAQDEQRAQSMQKMAQFLGENGPTVPGQRTGVADMLADLAQNAPDMVRPFQEELKAKREAARMQRDRDKFSGVLAQTMASGLIEGEEAAFLMQLGSEDPARANVAAMELVKEKRAAINEQQNRQLVAQGVEMFLASDAAAGWTSDRLKDEDGFPIKGVDAASEWVWRQLNRMGNNHAAQANFTRLLSLDPGGARFVYEELERKEQEVEAFRQQGMAAERAAFKERALREGGVVAAAFLDIFGLDPEVAQAAGITPEDMASPTYGQGEVASQANQEMDVDVGGFDMRPQAKPKGEKPKGKKSKSAGGQLAKAQFEDVTLALQAAEQSGDETQLKALLERMAKDLGVSVDDVIAMWQRGPADLRGAGDGTADTENYWYSSNPGLNPMAGTGQLP